MQVIFIELQGEEARATLENYARALEKLPHCQSARLLKNTQEARFLLVTEWQQAPDLLPPKGSSMWSFQDI